MLRGRHLHARLLDAEALRVVDVELAKLREGARVDGGGEGVRTLSLKIKVVIEPETLDAAGAVRNRGGE